MNSQDWEILEKLDFLQEPPGSLHVWHMLGKPCPCEGIVNQDRGQNPDPEPWEICQIAGTHC